MEVAHRLLQFLSAFASRAFKDFWPASKAVFACGPEKTRKAAEQSRVTVEEKHLALRQLPAHPVTRAALRPEESSRWATDSSLFEFTKHVVTSKRPRGSG